MKVKPVAVRDDVASAIAVDDAFLPLRGVHAQSADLHRFDSFNQRLRIRQAAAGAVDQNHALFHFCNALLIDHVMSGWKQRHMKSDDVALFIQGVQICILCQFCHFRVLINIIRQNAAAKSLQILNDPMANMTGSHNAHRHGA